MTDTAYLAGALERALAEAAAADGRAVTPVSLTLDYGVSDDAGQVSVSARVDRATKSLVFTQGEAVSPDGRRVASASAVFRVLTS